MSKYFIVLFYFLLCVGVFGRPWRTAAFCRPVPRVYPFARSKRGFPCPVGFPGLQGRHRGEQPRSCRPLRACAGARTTAAAHGARHRHLMGKRQRHLEDRVLKDALSFVPRELSVSQWFLCQKRTVLKADQGGLMLNLSRFYFWYHRPLNLLIVQAQFRRPLPQIIWIWYLLSVMINHIDQFNIIFFNQCDLQLVPKI